MCIRDRYMIKRLTNTNKYLLEKNAQQSQNTSTMHTRTTYTPPRSTTKDCDLCFVIINLVTLSLVYRVLLSCISV